MVKKNSNEIKKVAKKTTKKSKVVTKIEEKNTEENETSNEVNPSSQKGYSLRERTAPKKNSNFVKMNFDPENESFDSSHLKKKRHAPEYSSSSSNFFECSFDGCQKKFYEI